MLGIIMNGFVEWVKQRKGIEAVEHLEKGYGKSLNFKELKSYPEEDFQQFAGAVMSAMGYSSVDKLQKDSEPFIFKFLIEKFPDIPKRYNNLYSFLTAIADVHYRIPGAFAKQRKIDAIHQDPEKKTVVLEYKSPNKLDTLFIELIKAAAKYYREKIEMNIKSKMTEGANSTIVEIHIIK